MFPPWGTGSLPTLINVRFTLSICSPLPLADLQITVHIFTPDSLGLTISAGHQHFLLGTHTFPVWPVISILYL